MDLEAHLARRRARVEEWLRAALPAVGDAPLADPVVEAMRYAVEAGGKRLRPALVLEVAHLLREREERVAFLGVAVELVHTCSLVLDDLPSMDDASLRRGRPALHRSFDEAVAILAANALLMLAFETLARGARECRLPARDLAGLVEATAATVGAEGMIGGQIADLRSLRPGADLATVEFVHSRKTGRLFVLCVRAAASLARARAAEVAALEAYARNLGLAFQVTDDLLDATSTAEALGKDTARDRGKTTFVDLCGVGEARRLASDLVGTAKEALAPFGKRSRVLSAIADYVLARVR